MSTIKVNALRHTGGSSDNINLDSSARVLIGHSSSYGNNAGLQLFGTGAGSFIELKRGNAASGGPGLFFAKSRNTAVGSFTVVNSGDALGQIDFYGDDGTDTATPAAQILCEVDGTPGSNDMPGRLKFSTTADGASSLTEAMRIDSSQNLLFDSGYGSVATAYGVRAWINFDGSAGTIGTGRGSANMDAVTDNGTADYTVNFTNDMPDVNYAVLTGTHDYTTFGIHESTDPTVGAVRFTSRNPGDATGLERDFYYVAIVR